MIISLTESGTPIADQIQDQIKGLITAGKLASDQRLPSVRQLATDLGVAPGTVAKAYKHLEGDGLLVTRIGSGTRVAAQASKTPREVLTAANQLAQAGKDKQIGLEETVRILRAIWHG